MVMATPFLHCLKQSLDGELWAVGKPSAMALYHGLDLFDRFFLYDGRSVIRFLDLVSAVKNGRFHQGIVLPHSFRSALLFSLAGVPKRVGYGRNKRGFMLHTIVEESPSQPEPTVEHYLRILDAFAAERTTDGPFLRVTQEEERRFDDKFPEVTGKYVVFIAGAQYGPSKRWPDAYFSRLADMIAEKMGLPVYLLPGKGEEKIAASICGGAKHGDSVKVRNMDVRELKVCLGRAAAVVSNDTGPRHIAAALHVPTVVILGPMDERYTRYPSDSTHILCKDVPCRPCNMKRCDSDHECLKGINPEEVFRQVREIV